MAAIAAQIGWQAWGTAPQAQTADLPPAPSAPLLRIASFGEPELVARVAMLYLQAYDLRGDNAVPYNRLDYARVVAWLRAILETDPQSAYALFAAARIYAEHPDAERQEAVDAGADPAHIARSHEQGVARRDGVGGRFLYGR